MRSRHEPKNSWPEYERAVLAKLEALEKRSDDVEKRLRRVEYLVAIGIGGVLAIELLNRLKLL